MNFLDSGFRRNDGFGINQFFPSGGGRLALLRRDLAKGPVAPAKIADAIDEHIGFWLPDCARRVSLKCDTRFVRPWPSW